MKKLCVLTLLLLVTISSVGVLAENPPPPSPGTGTAEEKTDIFLLGQEPKDDKLKNGSYEVDADGKRASAKAFTSRIGDIIVVHLSEEDKILINNAKCVGPDGKEQDPCTKKNLILYLDGRSIAESRHGGFLNTNRIEFRLGYQEDKDYRKYYTDKLGWQTWDGDFFHKPVDVTIGLAEEPANKTDLITINKNKKFHLQRISEKTDIFLLGQEPKDDKLINGNYEVSSNGKRTFAKIFIAGIGDSVVIHLSDIDKTLIYDANCLNRDGTEKKPCTKRNIALYLNGLNIGERKYDELINANRIVFRLGYQDSKDYSNKQQWQELLGSPTFGKDFFEKPVSVTVGLANTVNANELVTVNNDEKFYLHRISLWKFVLGVFILAGIIWIIYKQAPTTGLLRNGDKDTKWSLARCQMAFWFILIIYSFLFVWGITGAMDTITLQTLVMMGLSAGTLLGSALIEIGRDDDKRLVEIKASIQEFTKANIDLHNQLAPAPPAVPPPPSAVAALNALLSENDRRITVLTDEIGRLKELDKSKNFLADILSERSGSPALHRFQVFAWTIVLGFIFVFSVWKDLTMPSFSDTLLALMGLSSITYLGFKVPENKQ